MMKFRAALIIGFAFMLMFLTACKDEYGLDPKEPTVLNLWHNYGGQMKETMDGLVDEFNETVGADKGIIINVTSISSSEAIHEKLTMIANGEPGAPELPDISTANPKTALMLADKDLLVDLRQWFTEEELSDYIPRFVEEGTLGTEKLYIFPTAKSTEVLFINQTLFDRFAMETGASYEDLTTFEGIADTAERYYNWTDDKTPGIAHDGKAFYHADSLFNLTLIGCRQLGTDFIAGENLDVSSQAFQKIWHYYMDSAVKGYFTIYDGYASELAKTGDIVCSTGSTAGVLFFDPLVTYPDNHTEPFKLKILPYPTFRGGEKIAIQRGCGMIVTESTKAKNYAAAVFLKWFTSPENNLKFAAPTGYLPVTKSAYGDAIMSEVGKSSNENLQALLAAVMEMQLSYDFYIPPMADNIDQLQKDYTAKLKRAAEQGREGR